MRSVERQVFLCMRDNTHFSRGWTWAYKIQPNPRDLGELCPVCGKGRWFPSSYPRLPLLATVEGGSKYPDVLGCGSYPLLLLSSRVMESWSLHDIKGYKHYPLATIAEPNSKICLATAPTYHHVEVTGRCQFDLTAMGLRLIFTCPKCGYVDYKRDKSSFEADDPFEDFMEYRFLEETWDQADVFTTEIFPHLTFCTSRIVELAKKYGYSNFRFCPLRDGASKCITNLDRRKGKGTVNLGGSLVSLSNDTETIYAQKNLTLDLE